MTHGAGSSGFVRFGADTLGLPGGVTTILRDLIHEQLGLFYADSHFDQLTERLAPLVVQRGFESFLDYYYLLKYDPQARDEWDRVMDALSVQETYFWREIDQIRAIVDVVVPHLAAKLRGASLRIWSVPCATGEEPLTIAMLLNEAGWFERASIRLTASDASPTAMGKARLGRYGERSFRNLPPAFRHKYFARDANFWRVTPELHRRVEWEQVNLVNPDQIRRWATAPIVFCRNVFIYFSDRSIQRTVRAFDELMPTPAYLCVGASQSLLRMTHSFDLQEIGGAFVYVKGKSDHSLAPAPTVERVERI